LNPTQGPERTTWTSTGRGQRELAGALAEPAWAEQRPPPPFLTWLALSTHAERSVVRRQLSRRRAFLEREIAKERATLAAVDRDEGEMVPVARLMIRLAIRQFEAELAWLGEVARELHLGGVYSQS
jgi:hypothetical protein